MKLTKDTLIEGKIVKAGAEVKIIENFDVFELVWERTDFIGNDKGNGIIKIHANFPDDQGVIITIDNGKIVDYNDLMASSSEFSRKLKYFIEQNPNEAVKRMMKLARFYK